MNLDQNFFELFHQPQSFEIDSQALRERYREMQKKLHPDKYAAASDREQRLAVQYTTLINEAFDTLMSPLKRARYLLELQGVSWDVDNTTSKDVDFLMQQMELREKLAELPGETDPEQAIDELAREIATLTRNCQESFVAQLDQGDLAAARHSVDKLQFLHKLQFELEQVESDLLD